MISVKTPKELEDMSVGGKRLGIILRELLTMAVPGTKLLSIEETARKRITEAGGTPSFMTVKDYRWATCLCVNDEVVHGIPTGYVLKDGDLLTIDIGMLYRGLHTDTAWTVIVGNPGEADRNRIGRFLDVGRRTLNDAIGKARAGNRVYHISETIEKGIKSAGFSVVITLVGHGVGRELHEPPQIPGITRGVLSHSPELVPGMTIAIEVIYAMGKGSVVYSNDDGWTIATRDGSLSAVFEHTVAVTDKEPIILTGRE